MFNFGQYQNQGGNSMQPPAYWKRPILNRPPMPGQNTTMEMPGQDMTPGRYMPFNRPQSFNPQPFTRPEIPMISGTKVKLGLPFAPADPFRRPLQPQLPPPPTQWWNRRAI